MDLLAKLADDGVLNEDAASLLQGDEDVTKRSIVLAGVTGDGKSSTGNTFCGSNVFEVSGGLQSATQKCEHADFIRGGVFYRVIDTVGLHDTDLPPTEVMNRFSEFADLTPSGIDAFLFIVRWGRFKPEHDAALHAFAANCGEAALQHTILVFTHCRETPESLHRVFSEDAAPASLRSWASRLQCIVGIDNVKDASSADAVAARNELLGALERILPANGNLRYSNEILAESRARLEAAADEEREAFQAAVNEWRRSSGPIIIEREAGVVTRPSGSYERNNSGSGG